MPDPSSTNLSDFDVHRMDLAHPLFREFKLGKRLQTLRRDVETGELSSAQAISLASGNTDSSVHTLLPPGSTAGDYQTAITSRLIFVTMSGSDNFTLHLPAPEAATTQFIGLLHIVHVAGTGNLTVTTAAGSETSVLDGAPPAMQTYFCDGTNWYGGTGEEALADDTA